VATLKYLFQRAVIARRSSTSATDNPYLTEVSAGRKPILARRSLGRLGAGP